MVAPGSASGTQSGPRLTWLPTTGVGWASVASGAACIAVVVAQLVLVDAGVDAEGGAWETVLIALTATAMVAAALTAIFTAVIAIVARNEHAVALALPLLVGLLWVWLLIALVIQR